MEIKKNDATLNRPEGERVLDAPYVMIDLGSYVDQLHREESYAKNGKNGIRTSKGNSFTDSFRALSDVDLLLYTVPEKP